MTGSVEERIARLETLVEAHRHAHETSDRFWAERASAHTVTHINEQQTHKQMHDLVELAVATAKKETEQHFGNLNEWQNTFRTWSNTFASKEALERLEKQVEHMVGRDKGIGLSWGVALAIAALGLAAVALVR